jgi:ABC-type transport system involved in cytochrome bd biosynthesis fused ATPase/permease subunit
MFRSIWRYIQTIFGVLERSERLLLALWFSFQVCLVVLDFVALAIAALTVSAFIPIVQSNPENIPRIVLRLFESFPLGVSLYEFLFLLVGLSGLLLISRALLNVFTEKYFFVKLNSITVRLARTVLDRHFSTPLEGRINRSNTHFLHSIHDSLNSLTIYLLGNLVVICAEIVTSALLLIVMLIWKPVVTGLLLCFIALSILVSFKYHIQKSHRLLYNFSNHNNETIQQFLDLNALSSELKLRSIFQSSVDAYLARRAELGKMIANRQAQFAFPRLILETTIIAGGLLSGVLVWYTLNISQGLVLLAGLMIVGLRLQPAILKIQNGVQVMLQHKESASAAIELISFYSEQTLRKNSSSFCLNEGERDRLIIRNLGYRFGEGELLFENLDLSFERFGLYVFKGQNGVGKSTLFEVIAGLRKPFMGNIFYQQVDLLLLPQEQIGIHLSFLPQKPYFFNQSICESLMADSDSVDSTDLGFDKAMEILHTLQFDFSKHDMEKRMDLNNYLSEGEKAKLGIARTLIRDTPIVLLDEPTSSLDIDSRAQLRELLVNEAKNRLVLLISHDDTFNSISTEILEM